MTCSGALIAVRSEGYRRAALGILLFRDDGLASSWVPDGRLRSSSSAPLILAFLFAQQRFIDGIYFHPHAPIEIWRRSHVTSTVQPPKTPIGCCFSASSAFAAPASGRNPYSTCSTTPGTFNALQQDPAKRFTELHPDIKIKFRNPAAGYEEAAQQILRDQLSGRLPDVAFNGINQIGLFVDRGLGRRLMNSSLRTAAPEKLDYSPALAELGKWKGNTYGLPFAVSTPVLYVNANLVRRPVAISKICRVPGPN